MVAEATEPEVQTTIHVEYDTNVEVRSLARREILMRLIPWGVMAESVNGLETFARGAFSEAVPSDVLLHGLEHETFLGIGHSGEPKLTRHPVGRAIDLEDREDGQYATFKVAKTARGDEVLALADEGIARGVSLEFKAVPGGTRHGTSGGRRLTTHTRARLVGASTTYEPSYRGAEVIAVRTQKESPVADPITTPEPAATAPTFDYDALAASISKGNAPLGDRIEAALATVQARAAVGDDAAERLMARIDSLEENARANFQIPTKSDAGEQPEWGRGDWVKFVLRSLSGESISAAEVQARTVADLITTDNLGVVPPTYSRDIVGIIDKGRPFLESTTRIPTPSTGLGLIVPKIVTRPTTGVQSTEKTELASTPTSITTSTYNAVTIGGYGDISLQLLKRSDPSYLTLFLDLLAEAYAIDADDQAVDALIAAGMSQGGSFDPDDGPKFGEAWANAAAVSRLLKPDTIWMSTAAVQQFIDAVNPTSNAPLYGNLFADFSAASGVGGTVSGLRPVHVPALDDETADIIVGPRRGFAWAEDGTFTLQVEVPAKAGRDVGLVGMLWFAPLYPTAFTRYWLES